MMPATKPRPKRPATSEKIRVARKQHTCTEANYHTILPGDSYYFAAAPPWHDCNTSGKWWVMRVCIRCAIRQCLGTEEIRQQMRAIRDAKKEVA